MIYELSLVAKADLDEARLAAIKQIVTDTVKSFEGEIFIEDDWGRLTLAHPTRRGVANGHFLYFLFCANNRCNRELARRFKINEDHLRHLLVVRGDKAQREALVKAYKTPFSKQYHGSVTKIDGEDGEGPNPRKFARRKTCYFRANNICADWKDPDTFTWLINEFGKISPARVTGVSTKHQRFATTAIKRARQIGIVGHMSNRVAYKR